MLATQHCCCCPLHRLGVLVLSLGCCSSAILAEYNTSRYSSSLSFEMYQIEPCLCVCSARTGILARPPTGRHGYLPDYETAGRKWISPMPQHFGTTIAPSNTIFLLEGPFVIFELTILTPLPSRTWHYHSQGCRELATKIANSPGNTVRGVANSPQESRTRQAIRLNWRQLWRTRHEGCTMHLIGDPWNSEVRFSV